MKLYSFPHKLLTLTIATLVSTCAVADVMPVEKGFTFSLGGAYNDLHHKRELGNHWAPEIGIGYRLNNRLSLEGIYSTYNAKHSTKGDTKLKDYRVDGFYDLTPWDGSWTPYAVVSLGHFTEDFDNFNNSDDTRMAIGGGVRKALTSNLSISADIRAVRSLDYHATEGQGKLALTWTFGAAPASTKLMAVEENKAVAEEPATETTTAAASTAVKDSDMDGIADNKDLCPNTPAGSKVDATGCIPVQDIHLQVGFDFDSDKINSTELSQVDKMGDFLTRHPDTRIRIIGYTDSQGAPAYNKSLSLRRAEAVRKVLLSKYSISPERIQSLGKGASEPLADNSTAKGRKENRRVTAEIIK